MKKILLSIAVILMLFACQNEPTDVTSLETSASEEIGASELRMASEKIGASELRMCASQEVHEAQLAANPKLAIRMNEIEEFTQKRISSKNFRLVNGTIEIPVVVNVLYKTSAENISLAQIQSQIDVLNEDFNAKNLDITKVPVMFSTLDANVGITFKLETTIGESGVIRKFSSKKSWGTNDDMKRASTGGINPTSPTTILNIWIVNKMVSQGRTILGYAQFPGGSSATDGVVLGYKYTGNNGTVVAPYNLGRTATHEVGHWMNLRHIWGDASCGNDLVDDTPVHKTANYSNTAPFISACLPTHYEMPMNYMDYTNDDLMYMFTNGQKARMSALFVAGGARASFGI